MAGGRVRFPLRDSSFREATDTPSLYGSPPAAMAEGKRVDSFCILCHVHFEDFEDDLRPDFKLAAHFTQGHLACIIHICMNIMYWAFDFP